MMVNLTEVKPKLNMFKVVSCISIIILLLTIPLMFIIKNYQNNKLYNGIDIGMAEEDIELEEIIQEDEAVVEDEKEEIPIVTLTEKGKENFNNIYHSEDDKKIAYLTFDDGPSKTVTPLILETLRNEGIKASFFVLGSRVELYPELVKQEYDEGHYIANHGYSHVYSDIYSSVQAVLDEYFSTQNAIRNALNMPDYNCYVFRFPGGSPGGKYANLKSQAKQALAENNIVYVDWNALNSDATGEKLDKDQLLERLIGTVTGKNSVVILMHDAGDKTLTAEMLPEAINYLREEGYEFRNFYDIIE